MIEGVGIADSDHFENPTCDPDPCAVELVRVVDLSDTDD
ncbi:unnamed protein product, partial [marine sediment metagenome]